MTTPPLTYQRQNIRVQQGVAVLSAVLLLVKFVAYYMTHSVSVLTDALESIVNVTAGLIGLYSLYVAARPADKDHPYGHGKAEFLSAAIEGTLIVSAGALIVYKSVKTLLFPEPVRQLDHGIVLIALTAALNYAAGLYCVRLGQKNNSMVLLSSGRHLQADTLTTLGLIAGLLVLYITGWPWVDAAVALLFAALIIYSGYKILRRSVAGIMDEADQELLQRMVALLNEHRSPNWIDLHNLRIIKYGSVLHLDCHLTLPWYLNVHEAHDEVEQLASLVRTEFGDSLELFVHNDGCLSYSCRLCQKTHCNERKQDFERRVEWTLDNLLSDQKHQLL